jgi:hypothetical protein
MRTEQKPNGVLNATVQLPEETFHLEEKMYSSNAR